MQPPLRQIQDKRSAKISKGIRFLIYFFAFFMFFFGVWLKKYFGEVNLEQILYHLRFGSEGLLDTDPSLIRKFFKWCILCPLLFASLALLIDHVLLKKMGRQDWGKAGRAFNTICHGLPVILLGLCAVYLANQTSAIRVLTANLGSDYFSPNYIPPAKIQFKVNQPKMKNLVLIYVESLETSYSNKALFGNDLLASLQKLGGVSFNHYRQAPGTGWTIAGIVATQCGLPLKSVLIFDGNQFGENVKSFLPNAICLSDILDGYGYRNVFMGGAALTFAGKGKFFHDHHYHEIFGRDEWLTQGQDPATLNSWGLQDDDLFSRARLKLKELHAKKEPFNLTLLTVGTHHPQGFISRHCAQRNVKDFAGIVQCTAEEVSDFVKYVKDSGYLKDTNVVVIGDHLSMKNTEYEKLVSLPNRYIYNAFISSQSPQKNREEIVHFDLFPSILEFIGMDVGGNRLGLGYSAFYQTKDQPPQDRFEEMQKSLLNSSDAYLDLWKSKPGI